MTTLNLIPVTKIHWSFWIVTLVTVIFAIGVTTCAIYTINNKPDTKKYFAVRNTICPLIFAFVISACTMIAMSNMDSIVNTPTGRFKIEATFSNDMSFTSVMKEYNILEQRGDIFVIEPKERVVN